MLANPASYTRPVSAKIWLDETRLIKALDGLTWLRYYESARAEQVRVPRWQLHIEAGRIRGGPVAQAPERLNCLQYHEQARAEHLRKRPRLAWVP
jgi:hypothetical protein